MLHSATSFCYWLISQELQRIRPHLQRKPLKITAADFTGRMPFL